MPGHTAWPFLPGITADLLLMLFKVFVGSVYHPLVTRGSCLTFTSFNGRGVGRGYWEVAGVVPRSKGTKPAKFEKAEVTLVLEEQLKHCPLSTHWLHTVDTGGPTPLLQMPRSPCWGSNTLCWPLSSSYSCSDLPMFTLLHATWVPILHDMLWHPSLGHPHMDTNALLAVCRPHTCSRYWKSNHPLQMPPLPGST